MTLIDPQCYRMALTVLEYTRPSQDVLESLRKPWSFLAWLDGSSGLMYPGHSLNVLERLRKS